MRSTPSSRGTRPKAELRLEGRPVARGSAMGTVVVLYGKVRQFYRQSVPNDRVKDEIDRFRKAARMSQTQLSALSKTKQRQPTNSAAAIFDAQLLMLNEPGVCPAIENRIETGLVNAEWAAKFVIDGLLAKYKAIPDRSIRERYIDLEDVGERLLNNMDGVTQKKVRLAKSSVIVAQELRPSTLLEFARSRPVAIITENGGWTSHTFIIARELKIPAVTGVAEVLSHIYNGNRVVVDGYAGMVIVNPSTSSAFKYRSAAPPDADLSKAQPLPRSTNTTTVDGQEIVIRSNSDSPAAYSKAKKLGARGIGLYRSETLMNIAGGFPDENKQVAAYSAVARAAGRNGVKIRTFDVSADGHFDPAGTREKNPALGLRAIRFGLSRPLYLRTQLRALLRASDGQNIDIVMPMVTGVSDILDVKKILAKERKRLGSEHVQLGTPRLGAMIEVPAAVMTIDEILEHVDFLCLGTNDLVQYLLATDRDNESAARWFATLHPAVLRAIKTVVSAATSAGKELIVCGEMAAAPYYIPLLIGLGARQLSMNVNSISRVRHFISNVAADECRLLASAALKCSTASEVEKLLAKSIRAHWPGLAPTAT